MYNIDMVVKDRYHVSTVKIGNIHHKSVLKFKTLTEICTGITTTVVAIYFMSPWMGIKTYLM